MNNDSVVYYRLHDKFDNPIADTSVNISATFDDGTVSAYGISANGSAVGTLITTKTNADGLIAIQVPKPQKEGDLVINCEIPDDSGKSSSTITFANVDETVAPLEAVSVNFSLSNTKQVIVTFNNQLVSGLNEIQLKKLFVVEDKDHNKLDIASITYNLKTVTITLSEKTFTEGENYTVKVNTGEECKINGIVYVLSDTYGQAMQTAQATKIYTCEYSN